MRTQSIDTSPEFERVQIAHLRTFSPARKFASTRSWTHSVSYMNLYSGRGDTKQLSEQDIICFIAREYGNTLATAYQLSVKQYSPIVTPDLDIQSALLMLIEIFDTLDITYALTGSLACSIYGFPRSAQDIDVIADIQAKQLPLLITALRQMFVFDEQQVVQSFKQCDVLSFLHLASLMKVDILLLSESFEYKALYHRRALPLIEEKSPFWILSPEDIALERLMWYQHTGAVADDQWNDILGLLKIQAPTLDLRYLFEYATTLDVAKFLEQGLIDAGLREA